MQKVKQLVASNGHAFNYNLSLSRCIWVFVYHLSNVINFSVFSFFQFYLQQLFPSEKKG